MTRLTNILAIATTTVLLATSSAFAGPGIGPENEAQYVVSSHESLSPRNVMRPTHAVAPVSSFDAHWGPAFDPSVN